MFDKAFFDEHFAVRIREFGQEHEAPSLKVEVVALSGDRFDILRLTAIITGAMLITRDDRLIFLPYPNIAYVGISILQDHRIDSFRLSGSAE